MSKTRIIPTRSDVADDEATCRVLHALRETPRIFEEIAAGPSEELAAQKHLRQQYPDDLVRAAMSLHALRQRAADKFERAADMWFDRVGLEQSTAEVVARHKSKRFSGDVVDLCCGIGGDTLALAEHGAVTTVDRRPPLVLMSQWNADVYEVKERVRGIAADVTSLAAGKEHVHIDPDRRTGARRSVRIEDYQPGLEFLHELIASRPGGAIKVSPASNFGGKFPGCEIELVSLDGECKEATVWFGSLAGTEGWRATLLPSGETIAGEPLSAEAEIRPPQGFVFDPDPAVVRSGLLDVVACQWGLSRLDDEEEYLTGAGPVATGFVTPFAVVAELPNNDKQIRRYFREHSFGQVEIKCRHIPIDADMYRRKLQLDGTEAVTLIFAKDGRRSRVHVCQRT